MSELVSGLNVLATNNFGDTREGSLAGPTGLVIILLLVIGTVLLIRNMNSRLKRLPERFDSPDQPGADTNPADKDKHSADKQPTEKVEES